MTNDGRTVTIIPGFAAPPFEFIGVIRNNDGSTFVGRYDAYGKEMHSIPGGPQYAHQYSPDPQPGNWLRHARPRDKRGRFVRLGDER